MEKLIFVIIPMYNAKKIVKNIISKDNCVKLFNKLNRGVSHSRNVLLENNDLNNVNITQIKKL